MEETETFYITFGSQYAYNEHPTVDWAHPDGWLEITVPDTGNEWDNEIEAREVAHRMLGSAWSMIYDSLTFDRSYHPLGCLAEWKDGQVTVHHRFRQTMKEVSDG